VSSRVSDVVRGYTTLASSLLERWSALASKAASKVDAGAYDATSAAEDAVAGATLATEAAGLWAAWTGEAFAKLAGLERGPNIAKSQPFHSPAAGAKLELVGPLTKGPGLAQLPLSAVSIQPPQLGSEDTEFRLRGDGSGHRGATYVGKVNATTDAGTTAVTVWITIP
jgi:hypothetical protein